MPLALASTLAACAGTPESTRPAARASAPPDRCAEDARPFADLQEGRPRFFLKAHESYTRARTLQDNGDLEAALGALREAVEADPGHGLARLALAELRWRTDFDTEAIRAHLAAAVLLLPNNPRAHLRFADASAELGQAETAVTHWRCALALKPGLSAANTALARHLLASGAAAEAEAHLRVAIQGAPDDYQLQVLLAQALEARGKLLPAAEAAAHAARLVMRSAPLFRRAASLYEKAGAATQAAVMRTEADKLDPPERKRALRPLRKARRKARKRRSRRR